MPRGSYFEQGFEEGSSDYFFARDHLRTVREVVGSDGTTIASRLSVDPWGKVSETGSVASDFAYTGHLYDRPSGLSLAPYRGYDPHLARWLSMDPLGLWDGQNVYGYVGNDPLNMVDPSGRSGAGFKCALFGAGAGGAGTTICLLIGGGSEAGIVVCIVGGLVATKLITDNCEHPPPDPDFDDGAPPPRSCSGELAR